MPCVLCKCGANTKNPSLFCAGLCNREYHSSCVKLSNDVLKLLNNSNSGLKWQCPECCSLNIQSLLTSVIEKQIKVFQEEFTEKFESLKSELMNKAQEMSAVTNRTKNEDPGMEEKSKPSYATIVQPKSTVIIKPVNESQDPLAIETDLLSSLKHIETELKIKDVKRIQNGGIVINCDGRNTTAEIKRVTETNFADKYKIKEVKPFSPAIKIVGMSVNFNEENFVAYLKRQNSELLSESAQLSIKKFWPTKKNPNIFQSILEVDIDTYNNLLRKGHVLIGIKPCKVFDAIGVLRCFKCNGFNHGQAICSNVISCPKCAGPHDLSKCILPDGDQFKCVNCIHLKSRAPNKSIDVHHAAWDQTRCCAYIEASNKLKNDLFDLSQQ